LPLGLIVLKKIENIIREEMNRVGAEEILMPALHPVENYEKTGRQAIEDLFHTTLNNKKKLVLGQSHEEVVVPLIQKYISSYRDLPLAVYQIQTKFRNELRAKSGLFRGREFIMKDLYSFHLSEDDLDVYYKLVQTAYQKIFDRVGISAKTFLTYAGGGTFSKTSHEFQTITESGEDTILICDKCHIAVNEGDLNLFPKCPKCGGELGKSTKSVEVANIFPLKSRYSDAFGMKVKDNNGQDKSVIMGCYGIGVTRLMGVVAELFCDEKGLIWPQEIAPFAVHLIGLSNNVKAEAEKLYEALQKANVAVLYDDRDSSSAGEKFADFDLIGIPIRVVLSDKTIDQKKVEVKYRTSQKIELIFIDQLISYINVW
ncbi:MAG: aminoacyl--tRNA ligase-related protein, partial [Patescibacteria group bacterium]